MKIKKFLQIRPAFIWLFFCLWMGVVLFYYLLEHPIYLILFNIRQTVLEEVFLLCLLGLLTYTLGRRLFRLVKFEFNSWVEEFVFCSGLGWAILAYIVMILGFSGQLYFDIAYGLVLILCLILFRELMRVVRLLIKKTKNLRSPQFTISLKFILGILLCLTIFLTLLMALSPPIEWDELAYHLQCPRIYLENHKIVEIKDNSYSYLPFTMEMLYTLAMMLSSDILAKLIHFFFGILTITTIFSLMRQHFKQEGALLSASIFYISTLVIFLSGTAMVELGLNFYELLVIYAFINWVSTQKSGWLILMAINSGVILGIKYTGIYCLIGIAPFLIYHAFRNRQKGVLETMGRLGLWAGIVGAIACPWYIKNLILTGNPVYPFLESLFGQCQQTIGILRAIGGQTTPEQSFSILDTVRSFLLPWNATIHGKLEGIGFDTVITPIYLMLAPLLVFIRRENLIYKYLFFYLVLRIFFWSAGIQITRYLLPILPLLGILLSSTLYTHFQTKGSLIIKRIILVAIIGVFTLTLTNEGNLILTFNRPLKFILGTETRLDYLSRNDSRWGYFRAMDFINTQLPSWSKILFLSEPRGYYCQREVIPDTSFHGLSNLIAQGKTIEGMKEHLDKEGITHILFDLIPLQIWHKRGVSEEDIMVFNDFATKHLILLYKEKYFYIYGWKRGSTSGRR